VSIKARILSPSIVIFHTFHHIVRRRGFSTKRDGTKAAIEASTRYRGRASLHWQGEAGWSPGEAVRSKVICSRGESLDKASSKANVTYVEQSYRSDGGVGSYRRQFLSRRFVFIWHIDLPHFLWRIGQPLLMMLFQEQLEACAQDRYDDEWNAPNCSRLIWRGSTTHVCLMGLLVFHCPVSSLYVPLHTHMQRSGPLRSFLWPRSPMPTIWVQSLLTQLALASVLGDCFRMRLTQRHKWTSWRVIVVAQELLLSSINISGLLSLLHTFSELQTSLNQ
jgi:hypothetical protein